MLLNYMYLCTVDTPVINVIVKALMFGNPEHPTASILTERR